MGQKAHVAFLLFLIFFLVVITGPILVATTRHEEELCMNLTVIISNIHPVFWKYILL